MPIQYRRPELITVILSTYNAPRWLEKSLWGYACQSYKDFEIVIADDGSEPETADLVQQVADQTKLTLKHVWHEDNGFRKCAILNRAIEAAEGDYLVFSDGDCIPRQDFLWHHYSAAQPMRFLSGGYYKLPMSTSETITTEDIRSGQAFSIPWLRAHGVPFSQRLLRLAARGRFAEFLNHMTTTRPTWNGNNASGWTFDTRQVNGFDERMRYGGEDRELGERLENLGVRGKHIRYQSVCLHLEHTRGYANDDDLQRNLQIRRETRRMLRIKTGHGIRHAA